MTERMWLSLLYFLCAVPHIGAWNQDSGFNLTEYRLELCSTNCQCDDPPEILKCWDLDIEDVAPLFTDSIKVLNFTDVEWDDDLFRPQILENMTRLREIWFIDCDIEDIAVYDASKYAVRNKPPVTNVVLRDNDITDYYQTLANLLSWWPSVEHVDLTENEFDDLVEIGVTPANFQRVTRSLSTLVLRNTELEVVPLIPNSVKHLDISHNEIEQLPTNWLYGSLEHLDASYNYISALKSLTFVNVERLRFVNLSHNHLVHVDDHMFHHNELVQTLDLSHNQLVSPLTWLPYLPDSLQTLHLSHNLLFYFNVTQLSHIVQLRYVDVSHNSDLELVIGSDSDLQHGHQVELDFRSCSLLALPRHFLRQSSSGPSQSVVSVQLSDNPLSCDCQLLWLVNAPTGYTQQQRLVCHQPDHLKDQRVDMQMLANYTDADCAIGSSLQNGTTKRYVFGTRAVVRCEAYGDPEPSVTWSRVHPPNTQLAKWDAVTKTGQVFDSDWHDKLSILPGGTLIIKDIDKYDIERYVCTMTSLNGTLMSSTLVYVRLDYSHWLEIELYSYVVGVAVTMACFALHMIWTGIRRIVLWRMEQAERSSRLRRVAIAMEKYRQKQIEAIQEKYARRMEQVRENYHLQVEQLRNSYMTQSAKLRGYRTAQMESMTTHWDNIRDNYNSQVSRVRDYGHKQMERLWEGYERQVNRVRTFSLQHRLRLMRQYKIKQRYLNKLLEGLNWENTAVWFHARKEDVVDLPDPKLSSRLRRTRAASETELNRYSMPDPLDMPFRLAPLDLQIQRHISSATTMSLSSYHSLPALDQLYFVEDLFSDAAGDQSIVIDRDYDHDRPSTSHVRVSLRSPMTADSFVSIHDGFLDSDSDDGQLDSVRFLHKRV